MYLAEADVVIVGVGPTGLSAALAVARKGRSAVIVDSGEDQSVGSRAITIHAGTLRVLEQLGCVERILAEAAKISAMQTRNPRSVLSTARFDSLPGKYPFAATLPQTRTQALLRAAANEAGVRFVPGRAVGIEQDDGGATVALEGGATVRGRFVIGADGMHSTVRVAVGIGYPDTGGSRGDHENMVLADVVPSGPVDRSRAIFLTARSGVLGLVPLPLGRLRVIANLADGARADTVDAVQRLIDERWQPVANGGRVRIEEVVWSARFRFRHHLADSFRAGRVLLAGDAGHVHSPAGGQGMNLGIRDAWYLASTLAAATDAEDSGRPADVEPLLDAYAANRRAVAAKVIEATNQIGRVMFVPTPLRPFLHLAFRAAALAGASQKQALALSGILDTGPHTLLEPVQVP
ncbi:FAD-dependent monooxygenase [Sinomonas sp. JGH33]|uniref:FAD-dependent monooxygenase n=1 Tax=Sinomonas terricola TaxID=3110330 RepID=A0ABU5TDS4_9MICC|nr:FAD-dependent monooxygenase [Sinomonas sp. JGH33]MEA5457236.1 FAD-dependent monooxygenase [Sinomonas sp. JGH33]